MKSHPLTAQIPSYLEHYIVHQDPSLYTPMDHASWRFILKISQDFFSQYAHQKYLDGLRETGISTERIPLIQEMDQCLRKFNWRAVAVSGFIPPAVFMEFLSLGILPIACDMRQINHLAYTPAPDIVHEAAGHAPIIADPEYSNYLRSYGEISRKAIYSSQDMDVYNAVRALSDIKEDPLATEAQIKAAEKTLDKALASVQYDSEATLLARMGWWTFEYGLVGDLTHPKIYGAGLLSSLGESYHCFDKAVKKVPFSVECVQTSYDITRPQPQLFVAPDFKTLERGLEELANQMAFKKGGEEGLEKAKKSGVVTTTELDSGIQISGVLTDFLKDFAGNPCYLQFQGPTQLSYQNKELPGQGPAYHAQGFSSPAGKLKNSKKSSSELTESELAKGILEFESGVIVEGRFINSIRKNNQLILATFQNCRVTYKDQVLFKPEWGNFDMACGDKVIAVFGDAADRKKYLEATGGFKQTPGQQKTNLTSQNQELNELYAQVRKIRESLEASGSQPESAKSVLLQVYEKLKVSYPKDWLLRYELLEICIRWKLDLAWKNLLLEELQKGEDKDSPTREMISRGLELLKKN